MFRVPRTITVEQGHVHTACHMSSQCRILVITFVFRGLYYLNNDELDDKKVILYIVTISVVG